MSLFNRSFQAMPATEEVPPNPVLGKSMDSVSQEKVGQADNKSRLCVGSSSNISQGESSLPQTAPTINQNMAVSKDTPNHTEASVPTTKAQSTPTILTFPCHGMRQTVGVAEAAGGTQPSHSELASNRASDQPPVLPSAGVSEISASAGDGVVCRPVTTAVDRQGKREIGDGMAKGKDPAQENSAKEKEEGKALGQHDIPVCCGTCVHL